jgi:hypothetical protein
VLIPAAIAHSPHHSGISLYLSPTIYLCWSYLDLLCMHSSQWIPSDVLQPCSASYISSWQSTARLVNSNQPKWHTVYQNKQNFVCSPRPSFSLAILPVFIKLIHFHFLIAGLPLCYPFPALFYIWFQNPTKSLIMGSLPLPNLSTVVLPPNCNP